jgi:hypothetical protein
MNVSMFRLLRGSHINSRRSRSRGISTRLMSACKNIAFGAVGQKSRPGRPQVAIAAISGSTPNDVYDPRQIVGQNRKGHLGSHLRKGFGEVRRAHTRLHRVERVLDGLVTLAHGERICIEAPCTASSRCSCSHGVIRRSDPGVHWDLIEQFSQTFVQ